MNPLEMILNAGGGGVVQQLGQQFGLGEDQVQSALGALLPALAGAVQQNTQQEGGLESLLGALSGGNHGRYLEDPSLLGEPSAVQDGNGILGHLLGGKDVSRALASQAAEQTGLGPGLMKALLPMAASLLMGSLSRGSSQGGPLEALMGGGQAQTAPRQAEGLMGMLGPLLDSNRNGSAMDDILGMAAQMLFRR